jgi:hypothetical protein
MTRPVFRARAGKDMEPVSLVRGPGRHGMHKAPLLGCRGDRGWHTRAYQPALLLNASQAVAHAGMCL